MKDSVKLAISILICFIAWLIWTIFTVPSIQTRYVTLHRPNFTLPNYVFSPIWTLLYIMMWIAFFSVWKRIKPKESRFPLKFFIAHLFVNALWPIVFFWLKSMIWWLIVVIILWVMILAIIVMFKKISSFAVIMLLPYLFWVSFAIALNFSFMMLN